MLQERYTGQTFKVAKALRTKLGNMDIYKAWEDYLGEMTDFLSDTSGGLNNARVLGVMNDLGILIESHMCGQPASYQGLIFMELCKMCVMTLVGLPTHKINDILNQKRSMAHTTQQCG